MEVGPIDELDQRITALDFLDREGGYDHNWQAFVRTSHVLRFRTMPVGDHFRSIVHVYTGAPENVVNNSLPKTDAFVLGSPRADKHGAREAAAMAAMALLEPTSLRQPFQRDLERERDTDQ